MSKLTPSQLNIGSQTSFVVSDETTTSTSYVNLTTNQTVTVTVGASGTVLVLWSAGLYGSTGPIRLSVAVSGASTVAANDNWSMRCDVSAFQNIGGTHKLFTGLTPGSTTFTLQLKTATGTGHAFERQLTAIPL